jgi:uncharacterized protein
MENLTRLRIATNCGTCLNKCCSQPYDWVYLTSREISRLESASSLNRREFVTSRRNVHTGHEFQTLDLPCRFFDQRTGNCTVYESRPLVCRIFPFYTEPLTGDASLLPIQCGENLEFVPSNSSRGWSLLDVETSISVWLRELWAEALAERTKT